MDKPFISIVIPCYNTEHYIEKCIMSFEKQNFNLFEIVVCDDGSSDNSVCIVESLQKKFSNIKLIKLNHSGVSHARNVGIEKSSGSYLFFCDSDDSVSDDFFSTIYESLSDASIDLLFIGAKIINGDKEKIVNYEETKITNKYDYFHRVVAPWTYIAKRILFINNDIYFPEQINHDEDRAIFYRLIDVADMIIAVNKPLYNYIDYRANSLTNINNEEKFNSCLLSARINFDYFQNKVKHDKYLWKQLENVYIAKFFDCLIFNIAYTSKKNVLSYYKSMYKLITNFFIDNGWKNNHYFYDEKISNLTLSIRRLFCNYSFGIILLSVFFKPMSCVFRKKLYGYSN